VNEKALQFYICWRADFNIYLFVIFNWETIRMIMLPFPRGNNNCYGLVRANKLTTFCTILRRGIYPLIMLQFDAIFLFKY